MAKGEQFPPALPEGDEQFVIFALVFILDVLTLSIWRNITSWMTSRSTFAPATFAQNTMTAQIDRYLFSKRFKDKGFFIAEVKRGIHARCSNPIILYQETAEMICWIMHDTRPSNECQVPLPEGR